jgi:hypothetical protein
MASEAFIFFLQSIGIRKGVWALKNVLLRLAYWYLLGLIQKISNLHLDVS